MGRLSFFILLLGLAAAPGAAWSAPLRVVASILPLHALTAAVMEGAGAPVLLIPPGSSPHDYALKPSDAAHLRDADAIIRIGAAMEPSLARLLDSLDDSRNRVITLINDPRLTHLPERRSDAVISHIPGGAIDPHLWLDPENAITILTLVAEALARKDPANSALYRRNRDRATARLIAMQNRITLMLAPLRHRPYLVFHDAYQYLEARYGLRNLGFVVPGPDHPMTGARHIRDLRTIIRKQGVHCLFTEPDYEPKLIYPVIEELSVRAETLDHLGASLPQGPEFYEHLMEKLAHDLAACLSGQRPSS